MPVTCSDLASSIDTAWVQTSHHAERELARWVVVEPELAQLSSLHALVNARHKDERALGALIRLAQAGEALAVQVLTRCMTPWLRGARARLAWAERDVEELEAQLVAALLEVIARYPIGRRPRGVVTGLQLDAEQRVRRAAQRGLVPGTRAWDEQASSLDQLLLQMTLPALDTELGEAPSAPWERTREHPADELVRILAVALMDQDSPIKLDEARLIARARIADDSYEQLADELGIKAGAVQRRVSRAERRLTVWATRELAGAA